MRRINVIIFTFILACVMWHIHSIKAFAQLRWFDSYTYVTSEQEKFHLDNFAYYLKKSPELTGYICYFVGKDTRYKKINQRAFKAKKYLMKEYGLQKSRIILVYGGKRAETTFILQPKIFSDPPPKFQIE